MARQSRMGGRAGEADRALPAGGRESLFCPKSSTELLRSQAKARSVRAGGKKPLAAEERAGWSG